MSSTQRQIGHYMPPKLPLKLRPKGRDCKIKNATHHPVLQESNHQVLQFGISKKGIPVKTWNEALCALGNLAEGLQIVRYFKENFLIAWILTPSHT